MSLSGTIAANKDSAAMFQPLILAEFTFVDASVLRLSTHPLSTAEGGYQYGGNDYLSRIESCDIAQTAAVTESGIDIPPSASLRLQDADQYLMTNYEKAANKGFKGASLILRVVLWEADTANFSSDSAVIFKGRCDAPGANSKSGLLSIDATSLTNMQRSFFPILPIQPRCANVFPSGATSAIAIVNRQAAADSADSQFYGCGYSPDASGGNARGNYQSGVTPFTTCDYTFEACIARLGNTHTAPFTTGNKPPIEADSSSRLTARFTGIRFVPPNTWRGKSYLTGKVDYGQNSAREEKYSEWVPMVYGTAWVDAPVMSVMGDPNSTRGEALLGTGATSQIIKVIGG